MSPVVLISILIHFMERLIKPPAIIYSVSGNKADGFYFDRFMDIKRCLPNVVPVIWDVHARTLDSEISSLFWL